LNSIEVCHILYYSGKSPALRTGLAGCRRRFAVEAPVLSTTVNAGIQFEKNCPTGSNDKDFP
jgi:hypothetical protein